MNATTDPVVILARAIKPTHWKLWDSLQELEKTTDYIAPNDVLDMLTRPSKSTAIKVINMSGEAPTNFLIGNGHNFSYVHSPEESPVEQIARLLAPEDWSIYDRLRLWGSRTGNLTPDHLLAMLTRDSLERATHYYELAVSLNSA